MRVQWLVFGVRVEDEIRSQWVSIGVKTTWGIGGWANVSRYHMIIPNVKLSKFKVAITGLLMTPNGGNRKGPVWTGEDPK